MGTETADDGDSSKTSKSFQIEKEDRKPLSNKLKFITAAVIFYGNMTFVSFTCKFMHKFLLIIAICIKIGVFKGLWI